MYINNIVKSLLIKVTGERTILQLLKFKHLRLLQDAGQNVTEVLHLLLGKFVNIMLSLTFCLHLKFEQSHQCRRKT